MLDEDEILDLVRSEVLESIGYAGEESILSQNRAKILSGYLCEPYGDEIEGRSSVVSSDIFQAVENLVPMQIKQFTQSDQIAEFTPSTEEYREEADQKQLLANYIFRDTHDSIDLLTHQLKDAHLGYVGVLEAYWYEEEEEVEDEFSVTEEELLVLGLREDPILDKADIEFMDDGMVLVKTKRKEVKSGVRIEKVPSNEFLISKRAYSIDDTPLIGKRVRKTRSELLQMGFPKDKVMELSGESTITDEVEFVRQRDYESQHYYNPTSDMMKDVIYLTTAYIKMDVTGKGKPAKLWLVNYAGDTLLSREEYKMTPPFSVYVPIPIPNRAIGSCIGAQIVDYQYWKTAMIRQLSDTVYKTLTPKTLVNENVEMDDMLADDIGQIVRVFGDVVPQNTIYTEQVSNNIQDILATIEFINQQIERRTGLTSVGQGFSFDSESLNTTATGFRGQMQASQVRIEMMNRIYADAALQKLFEKIIELYGVHANGEVALNIGGEEVVIHPETWVDQSYCRIELGTGDADRQQELQSVMAVITEQKQLIEMQSPLVDQEKLYGSYQTLVRAMGLRNISKYFNNPAMPEETLMAENEQLKAQLQQLQVQLEEVTTQAQDQLVKAEKVKQQTDIAKLQMESKEEQNRLQHELLETRSKTEIEVRKLMDEMKRHNDDIDLERDKLASDISAKMTELELKYDTDLKKIYMDHIKGAENANSGKTGSQDSSADNEESGETGSAAS